MARSRTNSGSGHEPAARLDSRQEALPELTAAEVVPSRLRPAPSQRLRLARERDPPEPDPLTALLGRSAAARGDSWSEQYDCCSDDSDDTGSQQSHGTPRGSSRPSDSFVSPPEDAVPTAHAGPLQGLWYLSGRQPNTPVVVPCARAVPGGPRRRAATRTEGGASPVRVSPWPNPVTRGGRGLQDAAVASRTPSGARSRRVAGQETAPWLVTTGSLAATSERRSQDDLRRHSVPAPVGPGTRGPG
jgi:hypothetical protein